MSEKKVRVPRTKPEQLKAVWGRIGKGEDPEVIYCHGGSDTPGRCSGRDSKLLSLMFESSIDPNFLDGRSLVQELELRGYDITTLKFSIQLKKDE